MSAARATALALLALLPWQEDRAPDPTKETVASSTLSLGGGGVVKLEYRTAPWVPETIRRMRANPGDRETMNQRLPLLLQAHLDTPIALVLGGAKLDKGSWRVGLVMNDAGAFDLVVLLEQEYKHFPIELSESRQRFPYLTLTLAPAEDGLFALTFQWGKEFGRVVFAAGG